jgi:hypothetical protein
MTHKPIPALAEEPGHIALRLRDRAGLLRLMDKHADTKQSSEGTAKLLDDAAAEIERQSKAYIMAVTGRREFRKAFADLRSYDIVLYEAAKALADLVERSLDVGPTTKNPSREARAWSTLRAALALFEFGEKNEQINNLNV